jgi:hypothetical protein
MHFVIKNIEFIKMMNGVKRGMAGLFYNKPLQSTNNISALVKKNETSDQYAQTDTYQYSLNDVNFLSDTNIIKYNKDFLNEEEDVDNPFDIISDKQETIMSFIHIGIENFIVFPKTSENITGFDTQYSMTGSNIKYKKASGEFVLEKGCFYKLTAFLILSSKSPACNLFYQFFNKTSNCYIGIHANASIKKTKCIAYVQPDVKTKIYLYNKSMDSNFCLLTGSLKIKCTNYS